MHLELRLPVFRGYWLLEYFSDAGKGSTDMEKKLWKTMTKYDDLDKRNSGTEKRTIHQRIEDEDAANELIQQPPQPVDVCWQIDRVVERIVKRSQPPDDSREKKKSMKRKTMKTAEIRMATYPHQSTAHNVHSGGRQSAPRKSQYGSKAPLHQPPELSDAERADIDLYQRVRHFLRQQLDSARRLSDRLRPRENRLPLLAMDKQTMAEIRSYGNPKPIVHRVMQASLLLLGYDEETTAVSAHSYS